MAPGSRRRIPLAPYVVVFADGRGDVDIEPLLDGPVLGRLRERAMFERVSVDE